MIKASELRIGNLVTVAHETNSPIVVVKTITKNFINVFDNRSGYDLDFVLPIQLTKKWLVRLGVKTKNDTCGELYVKDGWLCEDYSEGDGGTHYIAEVKYVHQLQNLYFALTGEELTTKK